MGDELCCSRQAQIDFQNSNMPQTNLITQRYNQRYNKLNTYDYNINDIESYKNNSYYCRKMNFRDYKIQKSQNLYIKPNIKQKYSHVNKRNNINNKTFTKNNINKFSIEIKGRPKNGVKKKVFLNNNTLEDEQDLRNGKNKEKNENINEINNNINKYNENEIGDNNIFYNDKGNNKEENDVNIGNNNNEIKISYHQNDINNDINRNSQKNEYKIRSESLYSIIEEKQDNNENNNNYNNDNINNNNYNNDNNNYNNNINDYKEETNENKFQNLLENNKTIIKSNQADNYSNNDLLKTYNLNKNVNQMKSNDNIFENQFESVEEKNTQINNKANINNNIQQYNNNIDIVQNNSAFETIKYNQNNSSVLKNSSINNNIPSEINIIQNPTFAPTNNYNNTNTNISTNASNLLMNSSDNINASNITNKTNYSEIFRNIDTQITNNPQELKTIFEKIDSGGYDSEDPVLSDEEVDNLIKEAERNNYKNAIPINYKKYAQTIDYSLYSQNKIYNKKNIPQYMNYQPIPDEKVIYKNAYPQNYYPKKNGIIKNGQIIRPLTPDYKIKENKIINTYPYDKYYNINNNKYNYKLVQKPKQNQYTPLSNPQKEVVNYSDNSYLKYIQPTPKTPKNTVKHYLPQKVVKANGQNYYLMSQPKKKPKQVVIQSPVKVNPPIVEYNETYVEAAPITISKALPETPNVQTIVPTKTKNPVTTNINPYKTVVNYPKTSQIITQKQPNNITTMKNSSKSSFINHSYLNKIQNMNNQNQNNNIPAINTTQNKYNLITSKSSNNIAYQNKYSNLSFSSANSYLSKTPRKVDKFGNPIYITSVSSSPKKFKEYENYKLRKSIGAFSSDDYTTPARRRRKKFNDNFRSNSPSFDESPLSTPRSIKKISYDMNQFNNQKNNNNLSSISQNNLRKSNINNLRESKVKVSIYEEKEEKNKVGIIEETEAPTGLQIEEHTNQLINKYLSTDLSDPNTFNKAGYNLFYFTSPEFFRIPQSEIKNKRKIIYYINNDPSKQAIYEGEVNQKNERHGFGKITEPDSTKVGMWRNNKLSGWARDIKKNGQIFEGKFSNNIINGKGVYRYKDVLYTGNFENGIRQGKGVLLTKNFQYQGMFNQGKIDGYGKIVFIEPSSEEAEYEGFFKENKIEGEGIMKWRNGNMYQGEMKNGKMNGRGRFIPKGGVPSDGVFQDNVKINA